jgi:menaquinone-dependent protoporphyrinogen oxidase
MSTSILVAYATKMGSTQEVAEAIAAALREEGLGADIRVAAEVEDLGLYDGVVLGGGLYMGRWHREARRFMKRHRKSLADMPLAVFALGPIGESEKEFAGARKQLEGSLAKTPELQPVSTAIFGGVIDPAKLHFPMSRMPASDVRDWKAIQAWAEEVGALLGAPEPAFVTH